MWDATGRMARTIGAGLAEAGVDNKVYHSATGDRNDILVEIARARLIIVGSPTLNNSIMPTLWPLLHDLKDLRFRNKIGAAFGSYGWSGESVKIIEEHFTASKIPLAKPGLRVQWQPGDKDVEACRAFGRELAAVIKQGG
jgi:flavorubredoxin